MLEKIKIMAKGVFFGPPCTFNIDQGRSFNTIQRQPNGLFVTTARCTTAQHKLLDEGDDHLAGFQVYRRKDAIGPVDRS